MTILRTFALARSRKSSGLTCPDPASSIPRMLDDALLFARASALAQDSLLGSSNPMPPALTKKNTFYVFFFVMWAHKDSKHKAQNSENA